MCFWCQRDWLDSWTLLCSYKIFDGELIQLFLGQFTATCRSASFLPQRWLLQYCTENQPQGKIQRYLGMSSSLACRGDPSVLWQSSKGHSSLHQTEVISWLEISIVLVRGVCVSHHTCCCCLCPSTSRLMALQIPKDGCILRDFLLFYTMSGSVPSLAQEKMFLKVHLRCLCISQILGLVGNLGKIELIQTLLWVLPPPRRASLFHQAHCIWECSMVIPKLLLTFFACSLTWQPQKYVHVHGIYPPGEAFCLPYNHTVGGWWDNSQGKRQTLFPLLDAVVCILLNEARAMLHTHHLFSSSLTLTMLLLVSTCAHLLPVTHPKTRLSLITASHTTM